MCYTAYWWLYILILANNLWYTWYYLMLFGIFSFGGMGNMYKQKLVYWPDACMSSLVSHLIFGPPIYSHVKWGTFGPPCNIPISHQTKKLEPSCTITPWNGCDLIKDYQFIMAWPSLKKKNRVGVQIPKTHPSNAVLSSIFGTRKLHCNILLLLNKILIIPDTQSLHTTILKCQ